MTGDGTGRRLEMTEARFDHLMDTLQMRQLSREPLTHAFREHSVAATMVVQRVDRLWGGVCAQASPTLAEDADALRAMAELSTRISWSRFTTE
jgi:hypothetical protein